MYPLATGFHQGQVATGVPVSYNSGRYNDPHLQRALAVSSAEAAAASQGGAHTLTSSSAEEDARLAAAVAASLEEEALRKALEASSQAQVRSCLYVRL
jgi:hypothetical protein